MAWAACAILPLRGCVRLALWRRILCQHLDSLINYATLIYAVYAEISIISPGGVQ